MTEIIPRLVSTIIPVYNRAEMVRQAVQTVLDQTYRPIEIILAEDGSTDETPAVCRELRQQHDGIILYIRHENAGPGPARELGRTIARGEFIQYLDSDDRLLPNKFTDQVATLDQHPESDVAYGISRLIDSSSGDILADPFKWTAREMNTLYPGLLVDRWWCTHTPLYRRSLTDKIGSWCDMRWSQDWQYDSRVGALKTKVISCGTYVSEHCEHDGVRQTSKADWQSDPVRLRNRVELLSALWSGACDAGVSTEAAESQHFARWCFSIARQCASQSMKLETNQLLDLAKQSAGNGPAKKGIRTFQGLSKILGPRNAARLLFAAKRFRSQRSSSSMKQSFEP